MRIKQESVVKDSKGDSGVPTTYQEEILGYHHHQLPRESVTPLQEQNQYNPKSQV